MRVSEFDFELPGHLIAQAPVNPRDSAKLLEVTNSSLNDLSIRNLPDLLQPGDLLVLNNTKVIQARLFGKRNDAGVEITLHKFRPDGTWLAFAKPARKLKSGDIFRISADFFAHVIGKGENGEVELKFNLAGDEFEVAIERFGVMPLPPYISRKSGAKSEDKETYQTIFAKESGAVAAPTAGLHFTDSLFEKLEKRGIKKCFVTLHVGAGTFLPVKVDDTKDHKMHSEWFCIDEETVTKINETKKSGGRIIAVGTTSLRTLETMTDHNGIVHSGNQETNIFITPGHKFRIVDLLLTNFHLPRSTLFMLVSAFAGLETMHNAYKHAIESGYRFYSYGDACLLHRNDVG